MLVPITMISAAIGLAALTVTLAVADYPLGVEPNYDGRAAQFQLVREQNTTNDRLRWLVTPTVTRLDESLIALHLHVEDRHAKFIDDAIVDIECIPIANADLRQYITLQFSTLGNYTGSLPIARDGLDEFRISVKQGADLYTDHVRRSIPEVSR